MPRHHRPVTCPNNGFINGYPHGLFAQSLHGRPSGHLSVAFHPTRLHVLSPVLIRFKRRAAVRRSSCTKNPAVTLLPGKNPV